MQNFQHLCAVWLAGPGLVGMDIDQLKPVIVQAGKLFHFRAAQGALAIEKKAVDKRWAGVSIHSTIVPQFKPAAP